MLYPMKRVIFLLCLCFFVSWLTFRCANPVTPEGGPKDVHPPAVTECAPPNYSTRFTGKSVRISFDEFISLKSPLTEILISPPLSTTPEFHVRGKAVVVDMSDSLARNATYIILFGNAISDITENNVLAGFTYVFSTGSHIDSLTLTGRVINAFDNQPQPDVYAFLYPFCDSVNTDSLPYLEKPLYAVRTDEKGFFSFHNLKDDSYKLFVLNDQTGDLKFNMPAEKIAFCDSVVHPWFEVKVPADTVSADSMQKPTPSPRLPIILRMFEEVDSAQQITKSDWLRNDNILLVFKYPARNPAFTLLNPDTTAPWCLQELSSHSDSLFIWLTRKVSDTLILKITENGVPLDTVSLSVKRSQSRKDRKDEVKPESLTVRWSPAGPVFNHFKFGLTGSFSFPLSGFSFSAIRIFSGRDTLIPEARFTDSLHRCIRIKAPWEEGKSYTVWIPDSIFTGVNGISHDTLRYTFQTVSGRDLGSLTVNLDIDELQGDYIIQLLTEKGKVVEESGIGSRGKVRFSFLPPGKYTLKAILDRNRNKRWDTGNYLKRLQPEQVYMFPRTIEVRGNWDVEEDWKPGG